MTTLLIDMPSGIAGDMLLAALLACGGDRTQMEQDLLALDCGPIRISAEPVMAGSLSALRVEVAAPQTAFWIQPAAVGLSAKPSAEHQHRPYASIRDLIARAGLPERVKERAQRVFHLLAESEAAVHGCAPEVVEFHEVGSLDAIADVVGCCLLLEQLAVDRILASAIVPGHGTVRCAHGRMPVPVPAVAEMLRRTGVPTVLLGSDTGELTTPTGCALVCALADAFIGAGASPIAGRIIASGCGAGHKVIPGLTNAVRCLVLDSAHTAVSAQTVCEIAATIDDATGEDLALAISGLLSAGALDAWLVPVIMKKGRPGHVLSVLVKPEDRDRLVDLILQRTSSIGVRHRMWERRVLPRREVVVEVAGQPVRLKVVTLPDGSERAKPEADDVAKVSSLSDMRPDEIRRLALAAWHGRPAHVRPD